MNRPVDSSYFFSIQPFWEKQEAQRRIVRPGIYEISNFSISQDCLKCVSGNGQMGIRLGNADEPFGYCFGVMDSADMIPQYGIKKGVFIRFAPGIFTQIFHIPSRDISAFGVPVSDILSRCKIEELRLAMSASDRLNALDHMFGGWVMEADRADRYGESSLARETMKLIWKSQGKIRVQELSEKTGYTDRYLQGVISRQIGLTPKKICKHVRFQKSLLLLENLALEHSFIAQHMGYSDQAHYCREFKDCSGLSPAEYRNIYVKEKNKYIG